VSPTFDNTRRKPYRTGELAVLFEVDRRTIIRWIEHGYFGPEGKGWRWTAAGPGKGDRLVTAKAVRRVIESGA
jgi:hypothetical protein